MFSLASIATMSACIFLFGIFFCVVENFQYMVKEADIKAWRDYNGLHFIQCACKFTDTCTSCNNENRSKRVEVKELIAKLKEVNQYVEGNIFKSVENVNLETVVAYKKDGVKHHFLDTYDEK